MKSARRSKSFGFTIVELLVVIVVIGILAAVSIVGYSGITQKAVNSSLQSDLTSASKQLKLFQVDNSNYPTTIRCDIADSNVNKCLRTSSGNSFGYSVSNATNAQTFLLTDTNGANVYSLTNDSAPKSWIIIGSQTWAPYNLNVGTKVLGSTNQTNNSVVEKFCYNDLESNCTTYGGLYQWNEMMQYVTTEGTQGICPTGSHLPSDNEWKTLDKALGMDQATADLTGWRGTDQGTQVKAGGTSGLNFPMAGYRNLTPSWMSIDARELIWSSTENGAAAWLRNTDLANAQFRRDGGNDKMQGFSVRCLNN
ncbi:MAG: prepilin-type N-terminal cleavage/methylation domain-containing protein [Candidatus Saccharibacteria bacterium]|nr:prepilin-type N-terminal cleavage/methylation domain-containing protein [Candidatus Saccharibacteria bacterium]